MTKKASPGPAAQSGLLTPALGLLGKPSRLGQRAAQQELDLRVDAAQIVLRPTVEILPKLGADSKQEFLLQVVLNQMKETLQDLSFLTDVRNK